MGVKASVLAADKQEKVDEIVKLILATFKSQYLSEYAAQLVQQFKDELEEEADGLLAGSSNKLDTLPKAEMRNGNAIFEGWLTKLGAVRKSWKRRWFVVQPDYTLSYYAHKGDQRPKGEMNLQSYKVRTDCQRDQKDFCVELYHPKRRCLFVYAESKESYAQWTPILREVCRKSRYVLHPDPMRTRAFEVAYAATSRRVANVENAAGQIPEGSEAEALAELVYDCIHSIVLVEVYPESLSQEAHFKRVGMRTSRYLVAKRLAARVGADVLAAIQDIHTTADQVRQLQTELRSPYMWGQYIEAEDELGRRIDEAITMVLTPVISKIIRPTTRHVLQVSIPMIADTYHKTLDQFHKLSLEIVDSLMSEGLGQTEAIFVEINDRIAATVRHRDHPLHSLLITTDRMRKEFDDFLTAQLEEEGISVNTDAMEDAVVDALQLVLMQAVHTLQQAMIQYVESAADLQPVHNDLDRIRKRTVDAMHHDCHASMATLVSQIVKSMLLPPFMDRWAAAVTDIAEFKQLGGFTADLPAAVRQPLDLPKLVRGRVEAASGEVVADQAVSASVAPLLGSRGGGQCIICQSKVSQSTADQRGASDDPAPRIASPLPGPGADEPMPEQSMNWSRQEQKPWNQNQRRNGQVSTFDHHGGTGWPPAARPHRDACRGGWGREAKAPPPRRWESAAAVVRKKTAAGMLTRVRATHCCRLSRWMM
jgi:ferredoxin